jgi:hypothetical protein
MIYTNAILALCAITQAAAFVVQGPQSSTTATQLFSSIDEIKNANPAPNEVWDKVTPTLLQGNSLKTFPVKNGRVAVMLKSDGRPISSKVELWHGPDYTPTKMTIALEDGNLTPFNAVLETPYSNTVAVFNQGAMEFPMAACVVPDIGGGLKIAQETLKQKVVSQTIQGGALRTFDFGMDVKQVQVMMDTDGRHLHARIELLQGPNNIKQEIEMYSSDGKKRPFFATFETPEAGVVVRIINLCPIEYPLIATVGPC